jgi:predicted MFS family arabinose efflux permease
MRMTEPSQEPRITNGYSRYVLGLLFVVYVFNFIDRQVLSILLDEIKADIGVSDTYMGFLTGFAFAVFYTFAGIPIARLADRHSRRSIIAFGLFVWSGMTAASGMVRNFTELAIARIGVGVGEAAGSPPTHSLLSDYFPPDRRATAMAIYSTGVYVGVMAAFIGGGWLSTQFGWRSVYLTVGLAGIPLALLVRLTIRELPRGYSDPPGTAAPEPVSVREALGYLSRCPSFLWLTAAASVQSLSGYGFITWSPAFLGRVHGVETVQIGLWLGLIIGVFGTAGGYIGGKLSDHFGRRDPRWIIRWPAIQSITAVPFMLAFLFIEDTTWALVAFIPFYTLGAMYVGPMLSTTQALVPNNMRATTSAILLFVLNMVGLGLGPFVVGVMNDLGVDRYGAEAIRYSLAAIGLVSACASVLFWITSRHLPADLARARGGDG